MGYTLVIIKFRFENLAVILHFPHLMHDINKLKLIIIYKAKKRQLKEKSVY
jgi:hypothetical protein